MLMPSTQKKSPDAAGDLFIIQKPQASELLVLLDVYNRAVTGCIKIEVILAVMGRGNLDFLEYSVRIQLDRGALGEVIDARLGLGSIAEVGAGSPGSITELELVRSPVYLQLSGSHVNLLTNLLDQALVSELVPRAVIHLATEINCLAEYAYSACVISSYGYTHSDGNNGADNCGSAC